MIRDDLAARLITALMVAFPLSACVDAETSAPGAADEAPAAVLRAEAEPAGHGPMDDAEPASSVDQVAPDAEPGANALFPAGLCDHVYALRAHGPDSLETPFAVQLGESTPDVAIALPWGEREVQVVGWQPLIDNKRVLHHVSLYDRSVNIMGWSPGKVGYPYPADVGIDMPTTTGLRLDLHYLNMGSEPGVDRSGIALCTVEGAHRRPKSSIKFGGFSSAQRVMVPPNTRDHEISGQCTVRSTEPVSILSVSPHAHLLARRARLTVTKPDGREHILHDDSFAWAEQPVYLLEQPHVLEAGDTVKWACRYDNESNKAISFGESTYQEMCILWTEYFPKGALKCVR